MTIEDAYAALSGEMYKYAVYFLKNHHDAQDAVSECFLKLMGSEKFAALDGGRQKAYIFTALRNTCFTALKRRSREGAELFEKEPSVPAADDSVIARTDMRRAMSKLDERSIKVIKLRFLRDKGIEDISAQLGLNKNNVKIMIFRGKKQLLRALGEQYAS